MQIPILELPQHLKRGLHPFYFIYGEESFLGMEAVEQIRQEAKNQDYDERECYEITSQFDWEGFKTSLNALTLFSSKRLIECRFREDKINKAAGQVLSELASTPPPDTLFLCFADKLDASLKKTAWFTALERQGITLWAKTLQRSAFIRWLRSRVQSAQLTLTEEVFTLLVERTEGNLLAAAQAIEKLSLYFSYPSSTVREQNFSPDCKTEDLILEEIHQLISADTHFSVFELVDALLMGSVSRTKQVFFSLKHEGIEPLLVLWAITREVRAIIPIAQLAEKGGSLAQGFREQKVWQHRMESIRIFLNRVTLPFLHHCLIQAKYLDDLLKGQRLGDAWTELYAFCLLLARGQDGLCYNSSHFLTQRENCIYGNLS